MGSRGKEEVEMCEDRLAGVLARSLAFTGYGDDYTAWWRCYPVQLRPSVAAHRAVEDEDL